MIQQRKKDYLQRIIDEFFSKIYDVVNQKPLEPREQMNLLHKCFDLFYNDFEVKASDSLDEISKKIDSVELMEQYAKLLVLKFELLDIKDIEDLEKALKIVNFIDLTDRTFSWNRSVLKQDILRLLSTY